MADHIGNLILVAAPRALRGPFGGLAHALRRAPSANHQNTTAFDGSGLSQQPDPCWGAQLGGNRPLIHLHFDKSNVFSARQCVFVVVFYSEDHPSRSYRPELMPAACVFCGLERKMTSEHVWGEWTKGYVPRAANKHNHANVFVPRPGEPEPPNVRIRAGDHLDAQVRIVCSECNSGWLSRIQNAAKSSLIPLFEGRSCTLDEASQKVVATWVAMATMTGEYLANDQKRIAIPQSDRTWIMQNGTPPPGWAIWIGHYTRQQNPSQWVKAGFPVLNTDELPEAVSDDDRIPTLQTTAFSVGDFYAFAMSSHFPEIPKGWDWRTAPDARSLLKPIWLPTIPVIEWPPPAMSDTDALSFSSSVIRYFDDLAMRKGYR